MQTNSELGGTNPADMVRRCAGKNCDKSFQGTMPTGWTRLEADPAGKLAQYAKGSGRHAVLCPKHTQELR